MLKLALTLFVTGVLTANDHHFSVTADNFAFITHGFNRRSYFHDVSPVIGIWLLCLYETCVSSRSVPLGLRFTAESDYALSNIIRGNGYFDAVA